MKDQVSILSKGNAIYHDFKILLYCEEEESETENKSNGAKFLNSFMCKRTYINFMY